MSGHGWEEYALLYWGVAGALYIVEVRLGTPWKNGSWNLCVTSGTTVLFLLEKCAFLEDFELVDTSGFMAGVYTVYYGE